MAIDARGRFRWILAGLCACALVQLPFRAIESAAGQHGELSGIHGVPVEGHDIVAGVEVVGTKHLEFHKFRDRLRSNGADLRLGWPLESQTLCRFKEVLRDVLREKGFLDAEIAHDTRPTQGNPRHLILEFTVTEGKRSRRSAPATPLPSPAQRCLR